VPSHHRILRSQTWEVSYIGTLFLRQVLTMQLLLFLRVAWRDEEKYCVYIYILDEYVQLINIILKYTTMQTLPPLNNLSLNEKHVDSALHWDSESRQLKFSIDIVIRNQIEGLRTPTRQQFTAVELLQACIEFTLQRLWDFECTVPNLDLEEPHTTLILCEDIETPFPDHALGLIIQVARMSVDVKSTNTKDGPFYDERDDQYDNESSGESEVSDTEDQHFNTSKVSNSKDSERAEDRYLSEGCSQQHLEAEVLDVVHSYDTLEDVYGKDVVFEMQNIKHNILKAQSEMQHIKHNLVKLLLELEKQLECNESEIKHYLITNIQSIFDVSISSVRTTPSPHYDSKRHFKERRLIQWCKIRYALHNNDMYNGATVKHVVEVPNTLKGSFFTGFMSTGRPPIRVQNLELEHVIAKSHMKNCNLILELANSEHIAMLTVFATRSENSSKGDKYLPLTENNLHYEEMLKSSELVYDVKSSNFNLLRRAMAARILCCGYLSLFMLERRPSPLKEPGSNPDDLYFKYKNDIFDLATKVNLNKEKYESGASISEFRKEWTWEAGLSLLRWHYLRQPYNPFPDMMYRLCVDDFKKSTQSSNHINKIRSMLPFYNDLISRRFLNKDMLSKIMAHEIREEVRGPWHNNKTFELDDKIKRHDAIKKLELAILESTSTNDKNSSKRQRQV
jgi:hypothetical protein